jgi:hypothetical protein
MNYFYENVPELQLPDHIQQQLIGLDRNLLPVGDEGAYDVDYNRLLEINFAHVDQYTQNKLGTVITWHLPPDLEQSIIDHFVAFFKFFDEAPAIRLQYVFGHRLPVHSDKIRSASIIHPLQNHNNTFTRFYEHQIESEAWQCHYNNIADPSWPPCNSIKSFESLPLHIQQELLIHDGTESLLAGIHLHTMLRSRNESSIVNPTCVKLVDQVEINHCPCLLNARHCHDVYLPRNPDSSQGRLSLYWKFSNQEFATVKTAYQKYVQSKI